MGERATAFRQRKLSSLVYDEDEVEELWAAVDSGNFGKVRKLSRGELELDRVYAGKAFNFLWQAGLKNHLDIVRELIRAGADVNWRQPTTGDTLLMFAVKMQKEELVCTLLEECDPPGDVNLPNSCFELPLHAAVQAGNEDLVQILLQSRAKINFKNVDGDTPLHYAVKEENKEIASVLLSSGCRRDIANDKGETCLHLAAMRNNIGLVQLLVKAGCDANARDKAKKFPQDHATDQAIVDYLDMQPAIN
ncbi:ANK1 [Branchiostoma lanceolatum]|uniref:ANK1 protein n=1 Tax=Branchiostoma lanceolatum TaxID=7740 RepID=A0A8K0E7D2_BRALA|nr:ANK1 [Branchiostoma lanceolatum]